MQRLINISCGVSVDQNDGIYGNMISKTEIFDVIGNCSIFHCYIIHTRLNKSLKITWIALKIIDGKFSNQMNSSRPYRVFSSSTWPNQVWFSFVSDNAFTCCFFKWGLDGRLSTPIPLSDPLDWFKEDLIQRAVLVHVWNTSLTCERSRRPDGRPLAADCGCGPMGHIWLRDEP